MKNGQLNDRAFCGELAGPDPHSNIYLGFSENARLQMSLQRKVVETQSIFMCVLRIADELLQRIGGPSCFRPRLSDRHTTHLLMGFVNRGRFSLNATISRQQCKHPREWHVSGKWSIDCNYMGVVGLIGAYQAEDN